MKNMNSKEIQTWLDIKKHPLLEKIKSLDEVFWVNPNLE
jgi:D-serine dehydratase